MIKFFKNNKQLIGKFVEASNREAHTFFPMFDKPFGGFMKRSADGGWTFGKFWGEEIEKQYKEYENSKMSKSKKQIIKYIFSKEFYIDGTIK